MSTPRATSFAFISLIFLLLHVLLPAIALPVQSRSGVSRSLYTPSFVQHDTALSKGSQATSIETPLLPTDSSPDSLPIAHSSRPSSRLFARTFLDPHAITHAPSPSPQTSNTPTGYRVAPKLDRRNIFDKIREGFQNFGKKVKEGFQRVGKKIKQWFQTVGNKVKQGFQRVKQGFQTAGKKIKQGFQKVKQGLQTAGKKMKEGFQKAGKWIKENGATAVKFGLNILSAPESSASQGISMPADKIPAKIDDKLEKGVEVMDRIRHPLSGTVGAIVDKILRRDFPQGRNYSNATSSKISYQEWTFMS